MTAKQQAYVDAILETGPDGKARTLSDAYRLAYSAEGMSAATVRKRASELRGHGVIAGAIAEGIAARGRRELRDGGNRRRGIIQALESIAHDTDHPAAARVSALKLLGEAEGGMFTHRVEATVAQEAPATEADTLAEIEATLRGSLH